MGKFWGRHPGRGAPRAGEPDSRAQAGSRKPRRQPLRPGPLLHTSLAQRQSQSRRLALAVRPALKWGWEEAAALVTLRGRGKQLGALPYPRTHPTEEARTANTALGSRLSCPDSLSTVCPFCLQLFLDDSKMKNFITCFKGIAGCTPSRLSPSARHGLIFPVLREAPPSRGRLSQAGAGVSRKWSLAGKLGHRA